MKVTDNSPSAGYIAWTDTNISYKGKTYAIKSGNTNFIYVYWKYADPTNFYGSNTFPTLGDDDLLVFLNKNGTHVTVPTASVVDGSLIVPESILTAALSANSVTGEKILAGTIDTTHLKAGSVTTKVLAADSVTANELATGSVTADAVAANAIGANAIAAGAVIADKIAAGVISSNMIATAGLDAGVVKFGTMSGDRILANTLSVNALKADFFQIGGENVAFNAAIANDTTGWTLSPNVTRDTSTKFRGINSFKSTQSGLVADGWRGAKMVSNTYRLPCAPDEIFTASVYWFVSSYTTFDSNLMLELEFYDAGGTRLKTFGSGKRPTANSTSWDRLKITGAAPANTAFVGVYFYVQRNGTAWFACPQLERGSFATEFKTSGTIFSPGGIMTSNITFTGTLSGATGTFSGSLQSASVGITNANFAKDGFVKLTMDRMNISDVTTGYMQTGYIDISSEFDQLVIRGRAGYGKTGTQAGLRVEGSLETTQSLSATYDVNVGRSANVTGAVNCDTIYSSGWFRSRGNSGWYNEDSGGGIYMDKSDPYWVRVYGNKGFMIPNGYQLACDNIVSLAGTRIRFGWNDYGWVDASGGVARWQYNNSHYIAQDSNGNINFYMGGTYKHVFWNNGTKTGGSIEVDGKNLGMSPIDSPQTLIEYVEFDVQLAPEGIKIYLDDRYRKAVANFAVFPNAGTIIEKGEDFFVISGTGIADIRIVGERVGYEEVFWTDLDALKVHREAQEEEAAREEEVTKGATTE